MLRSLQSNRSSIDADHAGTDNHRCWYARKKRRRERKSSLTSARPRRLKINADSNTPTKIVSPNLFDAPRDGSIRPIAIIVIKAPMPLERQPATDFSLRDAPWTISAPQPEHIDALESTTFWQCGQTKFFTKITLIDSGKEWERSLTLLDGVYVDLRDPPPFIF